MNRDRLAFIAKAPELVARVVRTALAQSYASTDPHAALDVRAFTNRALCALESELASAGTPLDPVERHELAAATVRAASCFATSRLARRLRRIPVERVRVGSPGAGLVVRDARDRSHVVVLEAFDGDAPRVAASRTIAASLRSPATALRPPPIHFFSLRDGALRSFAAPAMPAMPAAPAQPAVPAAPAALERFRARERQALGLSVATCSGSGATRVAAFPSSDCIAS